MEHSATQPTPSRLVLPGIIVAQFLGTSLWFSGNAVLDEVAAMWPGVDGAIGWLTSAVQLGFITGTLVYATLGLADRFAAHRVFLVSSLAAAACNALSVLGTPSFEAFVAQRFGTGFFLAGIYPVGMKLAASWCRGGLGRAIGLLVGALVLGTAFPHLLRSSALPFKPVLLTASTLAVSGGLFVAMFVPEGPHVARGKGFPPWRAFSVFGQHRFTRAALGYFGHMWELYAFWAFLPLAIATVLGPDVPAGTLSAWSFAVIAVGAIGCGLGGVISVTRGSAVVAIVQLSASGLMCLLSPWILGSAPPELALGLLLVWGVVVVGDSPQFSALGARTAPPLLVGTGLTVMTMIGFSITIGSIALLSTLAERIDPQWLFLPLLPGPVLGVVAMLPLRRDDPTLVG